MGFLRALLALCIGVAIGVFYVGVIIVFPFPFSALPLFSILLSLSLVMRVRASMFWVLLVAVSIADLYATGAFGVGILSFVFITLLGVHVSSDVITHRSAVGCFVISFVVGATWVISTEVLGGFAAWWHFHVNIVSIVHIILTALAQGLFTAFVCTVLYVFLPHWWRDRSPITVNYRAV